ncbi:hypothetical protein Q604_UNBC05238G0001, partial [human gut metagenome]
TEMLLTSDSTYKIDIELKSKKVI